MPSIESGPVNDAMAAVLVAAYKEERISQAELAVRTGISPTTLQRILAGDRKFNLDQLADLAEALDVPADELMRRAIARAERLRVAAEIERMSEGATQNEDPRTMSVDELEQRRRDRTLAVAATRVDPESETDEPE